MEYLKPPTMMSKTGISITVYPEDQEKLVRSVEVLSRAATGLALEEIASYIHVFQIDEEPEKTDP